MPEKAVDNLTYTRYFLLFYPVEKRLISAAAFTFPQDFFKFLLVENKKNKLPSLFSLFY